MSEALNDYFTPEELPEAERLAEQEGLAEQMKTIKEDPDYRLVRLAEQVEKAPGNFVDRFEAWKNAVLQKEAKLGNTDSDRTSTSINPKEILEQKREELTQDFRKKLAGGEEFDLTDPDVGKGNMALLAFDWIQDAKKVQNDPNAQIPERIKAAIFGFLGALGMKHFGGDIYEEFKTNFSSLESGVGGNSENSDGKDIGFIKNTSGVENREKTMQYRATNEVLKKIIGSPDGKNTEFISIMDEKIIKKTKFSAIADISKPIESSELYKSLLEKGYNHENIDWFLNQFGDGKLNQLLTNILDNSEYKENYKDMGIFEVITFIKSDIDIFGMLGKPNISINEMALRLNTGGKSNKEEPQKTYGNKDVSLEALGMTMKDAKMGPDINININKLIGDKLITESLREEITRIIEFGLEVQSNFMNDTQYDLNGNSSLKNILTREPLTGNDITKLYYATKGKTRLDEMNTIQQGFIYFNMLQILNKRDENLEYGGYQSNLIGGLIGNTSKGSQAAATKIPEGVKILFGDILSSGIKKGLETGTDIFEKILGAWKENQILGILLILSELNIIPVRTDAQGILLGD